MHLKMLVVIQSKIGQLKSRTNRLLLRWPVWCRQRARSPILVDDRTQQEHQRLRHLLPGKAQLKNAARLPPHVTVCRRIQSLAAPVWGEHVRVSQQRIGLLNQGAVDATREGGLALLLLHQIACQVRAHEGC